MDGGEEGGFCELFQWGWKLSNQRYLKSHNNQRELIQTPSQHNVIIKNEPVKKPQLKNPHRKRYGRKSAGDGNCHGAPIFCCCACYCTLPVSGRDILYTPLANAMGGSLKMIQQRKHSQKPVQEETWKDFCWGWKLPPCASFLLWCTIVDSACSQCKGEIFCMWVASKPTWYHILYDVVPEASLKYVLVSKLVQRPHGSTEEACHLSNS